MTTLFCILILVSAVLFIYWVMKDPDSYRDEPQKPTENKYIKMDITENFYD